MIYDYKKGDIGISCGNPIKLFYYKEDAKDQSVWSTDCSRMSYAIKMDDDKNDWIRDNKAIIFSKYSIEPFETELNMKMRKYIKKIQKQLKKNKEKNNEIKFSNKELIKKIEIIAGTIFI